MINLLLEDFLIGIFIPLLFLGISKFLFDTFYDTIIEIPYVSIVLYIMYGFIVYFILLFLVTLYLLVKSSPLIIKIFKNSNEIDSACENVLLNLLNPEDKN